MRTARRGFTLIELLIALVVVSIVSVLLMHALTTFIRVKEQSTRVMRHFDQVARVFSLIRLDITQAIPVHQGDLSLVYDQFLGVVPDANKGAPWISFVRVQSERLGHLFPPERVSYALSGQRLIRFHQRLSSQDNNDDVLLDHVSSIKAQYFDGEKKVWCDRWPCVSNERVTPEAVSVNLVMQDGTRVHQILLLP